MVLAYIVHVLYYYYYYKFGFVCVKNTKCYSIIFQVLESVGDKQTNISLYSFI